MKSLNSTLITLLVSGVILTGCSDVPFSMDKKPKDIISKDLIFKDKNLVESNLADIYHNTLLRYGDPQYYAPNWILDEGYGAVATGFSAWQAPSSAPLKVIDQDGVNSPLDYWPYGNIREANIFIEAIKKSKFSQEYIDRKSAEARYLRAHEYWQMVKRYGGVPLIKKAQSANKPLDELTVKRSSEKAIYDFIRNEMNEIVSLLPENTEVGRVDKYTALALKSLSMLYAGSIGEFGEMQTAGSGKYEVKLGIPNPNEYWQASYNASKKIIESGNFALYNEIPDDPAENFQQLFVDESNANKERIFVEVADPSLGKGQSWNRLAIPYEFRRVWGSNFAPFLNIIEEFEYADGSQGNISRQKIKSDFLFDVDNVFRNRDPRFLATFFFPESKFQGGEVHFHKNSVTAEGDTVTSGTVGEGNMPAAAPPRNSANTGFLTRKLMDPSEKLPGPQTSDEDFLVFRYGEILLNYAEAAFYLGKKGEALRKINMIRERAGMPKLSSITEEAIRHERTVELVFEDHRYWDLRRWRVADEFLDGLRGKGLQYTYHVKEDKYDFKLINQDPRARIFQERHYYLPLGIDRIVDNPKLVENPGY